MNIKTMPDEMMEVILAIDPKGEGCYISCDYHFSGASVSEMIATLRRSKWYTEQPLTEVKIGCETYFIAGEPREAFERFLGRAAMQRFKTKTLDTEALKIEGIV